jgi:hypothetical protein
LNSSVLGSASASAELVKALLRLDAVFHLTRKLHLGERFLVVEAFFEEKPGFALNQLLLSTHSLS